MNYKGIQAEIEYHRERLDRIDELGLMLHFSVRDLRGSSDKRTHLSRMQAPLCLAEEIEHLERNGWNIHKVTKEERSKGWILKGQTNDGGDYHLSYDQQDLSNPSIVACLGEGTFNRPISDYKPKLFEESRGTLGGLVDRL